MTETDKMTEEGCVVEKEKGEERDTRGFFQLPPELKIRIVSLLSAGDSFVYCRLVSKSLKLNLATLSIPIKPDPHPRVPYLISLYGDNFLNFYHPISTCSYMVQIQELSEAHIRFSNHGWLLMSTVDRGVFFFEPFSKEKIELPKYPQWKDTTHLCFSSPPTSKDCFVLGVDGYGNEYHIIRRGETRWENRSFDKNGRQHFYMSAGVPPVVHNGLCYCLGDWGYLGVFDPNAVQPYWRVFGNRYDDYLYESLRQPYLVAKNNGEILRILVLDNKKVKCSKYSTIKKLGWLEQTNLGDKMLFLSSTSSFMGSINLRGMHNTVYFPMFHEDALLFYSLRHTKYFSFHDDYSSKNCSDGVKDFTLNSAWLTPVSSDTFVDEW